MPFAAMRGLVAILLEQTGDRRQLRIEPVGLADFGVARAAGGDADEADVGRETPGQEARARRGTDRRRVVEFGEQHAFARGAVEVGGLDLLLDRKRVVAGKSGYGRLDFGGTRVLK